MGNGGSSLVDCVQECDTQRLKQQLAARVADVEDGELSDAELHGELEDAVHTAVSMEITTPHQYQQLQIALELLLHVAPTALQTTECNDAQWSALHRACVTSNLAFVAFLFHRFAAYLATDRDAYGLLPLDLVPPELAFIGAHAPASDHMSDVAKALPSTERERIELALAVLRQRKRAFQSRAVRAYLTRDVDNQEESATDTSAEEDPNEPYFVAFEPSRGQLSNEVAGVVHQLDQPLRVRYHLPRTDAFVFGYFQLIWRADDEPRSQEPNYERHVLLRESVDLDHAAPRSEDLASNQHEQRRLHDADKSKRESSSATPTLTGSVAIDVSHLGDDVVCHVLFVASDRQLMKREIVVSTEGVRLVRADVLNADPLGAAAPHEGYYEEPPFEYDVDSDGDGDVDGFVFHVGGEAFKHPSEELAGRAFDTVDEFEAFVKQLRANTKQRATTMAKTEPPGKQMAEADGAKVKDAVVRRPSVLSNQEEEHIEEEEDDDELVLVEASKELRLKDSPELQDGRKDNQSDG